MICGGCVGDDTEEAPLVARRSCSGCDGQIGRLQRARACHACSQSLHRGCTVRVSHGGDVLTRDGQLTASAVVTACKPCATRTLASDRQRHVVFYTGVGVKPRWEYRLVCRMARRMLLQRFGITVDAYPHAFRRDIVEADRLSHLARARADGRTVLRDVTVTDIELPGHGQSVSVLQPGTCTVAADGVITVCLFLHGGFFCIGTHNEPGLLRQLGTIAVKAGVVFVSASYRKNPEHRFPAMQDDADGALNWITQVLPRRHDLLPPSCRAFRVAVMGLSAGGNLACSLAHSRRAIVSYGLYLCPILDLASFDTPSWIEHGADDANLFITRRAVTILSKHVFSTESDALLPRASPIREVDWDGVPPFHCIAGGFDPLRDDALSYLKAARAGGVPGTATVYSNCTHGWSSYPFPTDEGVEVVLEISSVLLRLAQDSCMDATKLVHVAPPIL